MAAAVPNPRWGPSPFPGNFPRSSSFHSRRAIRFLFWPDGQAAAPWEGPSGVVAGSAPGA